MVTQTQQYDTGGFDFAPVAEKVLRELLEPAARLEELKRKAFLSSKEVEILYGIPESTLRTLRCRGGGPDYHQQEKTSPVRYTHDAIKNFMASNRVRG